jgi:hypothetical protein
VHIVAGFLYAVAALCELLGILLVVKLARKLRHVLRTGAVGRIDGGDASGHSSQLDAADVLGLLAEDAAYPRVAIALLVAGIIAGTAGSFLTL